jgi:exosortase F-associated protein
MKVNKVRAGVGIFAAIGLLVFFLFQQTDFVGMFIPISHPTVKFILHRTFRFLINDALAIGLIFAFFGERKYVLFAVAVQLFGFLFLLIPYFILKIYWPYYNGPLINFLHRIVLNPILIMLLIPAFYYQKRTRKP